jgi:hypothetical protein
MIHEAEPQGCANVISAAVVERSFLGDSYRYWLGMGEGAIVVQTDARIDANWLTVEIPEQAIQIFDAPADT